MKRKTYRHLAIMLGLSFAMLLLIAPQFSSAQGTPAAEDTAAVASPAAADLIAEGEGIYNSTCIACHQAGGAGVKAAPGSAPTMNGAIPALANNPFETLEDPEAVVLTVLNGRAGMPAFNSSFSDEQIAAVISYVRQAFGNDAAPVSPDVVAKARAESVGSPLPFAPVPSGSPEAIQGLGN